MKNFQEIIEKALKDGQILTEEDLKSVNGGDWVIVEEGDRTFDCMGQPHRSVFHYAVEDRGGLNWWIHVTGICTVCGSYNDYYILNQK